MELQVVQPLNKKTYQLFCIQQQVGQTVGLITSHLIVMRHGLPRGRRKQNWPGLKLKQSQCSGRIRRRQINSSYEANERRRVHQRDQAFHDSLISFLFVHFLLVRHFFAIHCRFTHISFQAFDFLYFIPSLYGNTMSITDTEICKLGMIWIIIKQFKQINLFFTQK